MVTDSDIIARAVWKLNLPPGEVTKAFHIWVDEIVRLVRSGYTAVIPGVGSLKICNGRAVFIQEPPCERVV